MRARSGLSRVLRGALSRCGASVRTFEVACACTSPGDCEAGAACGNTLCSGKAAGMACNACLRDPDAGDCQNEALKACKADTACDPFAGCVTGCLAPADAGAD